MEDRNKKNSIENIFEDSSTLKIKKYRLIFDKKGLSNSSETNRLPISDNIHQLSHWDLLQLQAHSMSLDLHEERKWKKGASHVFANQAAGKVKKAKSKKKLDELYKRCMCLYLSMNINNNLTDITLGKDNKNMTERLNSYIKNNTNVEELYEEFAHWKVSLAELKVKLQKKFGEKNMSRAKNFLKVLNLMENMISIQEETVKRINAINERSRKQEERMQSPENLTINFLADIDFEMNSNDRFRMVADPHLFIEYAENSNLDFNTLGKEINDLIEEISNELNNHEDTEIFLSPSIEPSDQQSITKPQSSEYIDFMQNLNPKQLFFDLKEAPKNPRELKLYCEKKISTDKVEILPKYNYKRMAGTEIEINSDFEKNFNKIFPPIFFIDKSSHDKMLIESQIDFYRTKNDKILKDPDHLKLYNLKFENATTVQKLIMIWGICYYGAYMSIVCEIPNIFTLSRSINYEPEEASIFLDKTLEQVGVDMHVSNWDNVRFLYPYNKKGLMFIHDIDPPMLNSTNCNFSYNKKMKDYITYKTNTLNNQEPACGGTTTMGTKQKISGIKNSMIASSNGSNSMMVINDVRPISLISQCPIYKSPLMKKSMFKNIKEEIKRICEKVESMSFITMSSTNSSQSMVLLPKSNRDGKQKVTNSSQHPSGVGISNSANSGSALSKQDLLAILNSSKNDLNIKAHSETILDVTKPNVKPEILEGVSFYSFQSIQKEWEILRNPWYQNNTQFKPKFRKHNKLPNILQPNGNIQYQNNVSGGVVNPSLLRNLNDNRQ